MSISTIIENNQILLLFIVISVGVLLGSVKIRGKNLGVSMVLFAGLVIGFLNPDFKISSIILILGLSLFIYSIGLNSGQMFFKSYRQNGMRDIVFSLSMIAVIAILAVGFWFLFDFNAATIAGLYAGVSTNTPAFAAVMDYIQNNEVSAVDADFLVVAYTLAYPIGIIGSMLGIMLMQRLLKIDFKQEYKNLRTQYPLDNDLTSIAAQISNDHAIGSPVRDLLKDKSWNLRFGRYQHNNKLRLTTLDTIFEHGDTVMILGSKEDVYQAANFLGSKMEQKLSYDRSKIDSRRIFLSNPKLAGKTIASLNLYEKFDASIIRIRRGDNDMLATGSTILELGDRIRIIAKREELAKLSAYFGDSYHASSRINLFSFGFGLSLGLLLGSIEFPLGNGIHIKLGYAGGPLIVGLILGSIKRTGAILWTLPYSTSVLLQQLGLMFILAFIGVNNGALFFNSFNNQSIWIVLTSLILTISSAMLILFVGFKWVKMPFSLLMGMVSNQPAVLEFANEKAGSKIPQIGYSLILPIVIILKLIITQLLYIILS